jgi:tRNA (cmo5U34)-methyltransferase
VRRVLDLGCGDGVLGRAALREFPNATGVFLDFSEPMLAAARRKVRVRGTFVLADFADPRWTQRVRGQFDAIVSGFAIHHLPDRRKRQLYTEVFARLNPGGIFLNLEHVASASPLGEHVFHELFIDSLHAFHPAKARQQVANEYHNSPGRAANILAPVATQCRWLRRIGYVDVDCFFKIGELALFGGVRR